MNPKGKDSTNPSGFNVGVKRSIDAIRSSLSEDGAAQNEVTRKLYDRWSKSKSPENSNKKTGANASNFLPSFLVTNLGLMPNHKALGNKLKNLRPENRKGKWFSLQELSNRVAKLKEAEKKEREAIESPVSALRDGIAKQGEKEKSPSKFFYSFSLASA